MNCVELFAGEAEAGRGTRVEVLEDLEGDFVWCSIEQSDRSERRRRLCAERRTRCVMSLEEFKRNFARWRFEGQYHRSVSGRDENLLLCEEVSLLKDRMRQRNTTRGYPGSGAMVLSLSFPSLLLSFCAISSHDGRCTAVSACVTDVAQLVAQAMENKMRALHLRIFHLSSSAPAPAFP